MFSVKRLNIIKILSNKSWQLKENTLIQLYNTLIRSIVEYSSILYPRIEKTNWKKDRSYSNQESKNCS
jgi:hypothetical protein